MHDDLGSDAQLYRLRIPRHVELEDRLASAKAFLFFAQVRNNLP
jgi:hypothetical protein